MTNSISKDEIIALLDAVKDPEIPVISVRELGVLRDVDIASNGKVTVSISPTYTGCPAMDVMREDIVNALNEAGIDADVRIVLSPAWTTDWITEAGKKKLKAYGIAPPEHTSDIRALRGAAPVVPCPQCGSKDTEMISLFGSTACKALWRCNACLEPFDQFKCL